VECQRYSIYPNPRISIIFRSHIRKQKVCSGKISHGYWIEIFKKYQMVHVCYIRKNWVIFRVAEYFKVN